MLNIEIPFVVCLNCCIFAVGNRMIAMNKLYYLELDKSKPLNDMYKCLKSFGLLTDVIENYYNYHTSTTGELIMWCYGEKYPAFVFRNQEDIIRKCGERVMY